MEMILPSPDHAHRGAQVASTKAVEPMTRRFVEAIEQFVRKHQIPMVTFQRGQRKDELADHRVLHLIQARGTPKHATPVKESGNRE